MSTKEKKANQMLYGVVASFVGGLLAVTYFLNQETLYDTIQMPDSTEITFETQSFINADQLQVDEVDAYLVFENTTSQDAIDQILSEIMQDAIISPSGYYQPYKELSTTISQDREKVYVLEEVNIGMLARKYMRNPYVKYVEPKDMLIVAQDTSSCSFVTDILFEENTGVIGHLADNYKSYYDQGNPLGEVHDRYLQAGVLVVEVDPNNGNKNSDIWLDFQIIDNGPLGLSKNDFELEKVGFGDAPSLLQYNTQTTVGYQLKLREDNDLFRVGQIVDYLYHMSPGTNTDFPFDVTITAMHTSEAGGEMPGVQKTFSTLVLDDIQHLKAVDCVTETIDEEHLTAGETILNFNARGYQEQNFLVQEGKVFVDDPELGVLDLNIHNGDLTVELTDCGAQPDNDYSTCTSTDPRMYFDLLLTQQGTNKIENFFAQLDAYNYPAYTVNVYAQVTDGFENAENTFQTTLKNRIRGCMDPDATNFDPYANFQDASCQYDDGGDDDTPEEDPTPDPGSGDPGTSDPNPQDPPTTPVVATENNCVNGLDDDNDGLSDCADNDCQVMAYCTRMETVCLDMFDNDGDGLVDCEDSDCAGIIQCVSDTGEPHGSAPDQTETEIDQRELEEAQRKEEELARQRNEIQEQLEKERAQKSEEEKKERQSAQDLIEQFRKERGQQAGANPQAQSAGDPRSFLANNDDEPDDFYYGEQRYLNQYGYGYTQDQSCEARYKTIYLIDNGFASHEEVDYDTDSYDVADSDTNTTPSDISTRRVHGLRMAGLIASKKNNGIGVASVGDHQLVAIKATKDASDNPDVLTHACEGLMYAYQKSKERGEENRLAVIPAGSRRLSRTCTKLIDALGEKGMTLVAAAGNEDKQYKKYPAAHEDVIAVAASNQVVKKTSFSNYGGRIDYTAPGESIMTTSLNNGYEKTDGTSASASLVAARIAGGYEKVIAMNQEPLYQLGNMGKGVISYEICGDSSPLPNPSPNPGPDSEQGRLMKVTNTQRAGPGDMITYELRYMNISDVLQNVILTDELPSYLSLIDANIEPDDFSNGNLIWKFSDLEPTEEVRIKFTVRVLENPAPLNNGEMIKNCAKASTTEESSCVIIPYIDFNREKTNP